MRKIQANIKESTAWKVSAMRSAFEITTGGVLDVMVEYYWRASLKGQTSLRLEGHSSGGTVIEMVEAYDLDPAPAVDGGSSGSFCGGEA